MSAPHIDILGQHFDLTYYCILQIGKSFIIELCEDIELSVIYKLCVYTVRADKKAQKEKQDKEDQLRLVSLSFIK